MSNKYDDFAVIERYIISCKTFNQALFCDKMIKLFARKHHKKIYSNECFLWVRMKELVFDAMNRAVLSDSWVINFERN